MSTLHERFNSLNDEKIRQPGWDETYTPEVQDDEANPYIDVDEPVKHSLTHRPFQFVEF